MFETIALIYTLFIGRKTTHTDTHKERERYTHTRYRYSLNPTQKFNIIKTAKMINSINIRVKSIVESPKLIANKTIVSIEIHVLSFLNEWTKKCLSLNFFDSVSKNLLHTRMRCLHNKQK
jgi:hypothetical protein